MTVFMFLPHQQFREKQGRGSRLEPAIGRADLAQIDHLVGILIGAGALAGAVVLYAEHALAINALDVVADQLVRRPQLAAVFARPAAAVCALKPPTGPPGPEGVIRPRGLPNLQVQPESPFAWADHL